MQAQVQARSVESISRFAGRRPPVAPPAVRSPLAALDAIESLDSRRKILRGQEIYAAGDAADHCYRIVSGGVRMVGLMEDGRRYIAEFLLPGDLFGFDSLGVHHLSAEAITDVVVIRYARRLVDRLAERDGLLAKRLHHLTLQRLQRAQEKMFLLGRSTAGERVAVFLLEMARRDQGNGGAAFELPMTRADIADHLGLTIETVSRTIAQLGRDGVIAVSKGEIGILDLRALKEMGGEQRH